MTGMFGSAARWLVGLLIGLIGAPILAGLISIGVDEATASEFVLRMSSFLEVAIFIALTFGSAKLLTVFKFIDPGAFAQRIWQKDIGQQIASLPKEDARYVIKQQQANLTITPRRYNG